MRLLTKTGIVYLLGTTFVFLAGGIVFYHNLRSITDEETTEKLLAQKHLFLDYIEKHDTLPGPSYDADESDSIAEVSHAVTETFADTNYYSHGEDEVLPYRTLIFPATVKGKNYAVRISKPLFESDDLVETILLSFSIITGVLLLVVYFVNRVAAGRLWKPFFDTMQQLNRYELGREEKLKFSPTTTDEFHRLNEALEKMTGKISADYLNLKSFTENASHELQTPLSVILNSAELLMLDEQLSPAQAESIQRIYHSVKKLSRMNQSLLLLAKIGNRQFQEKEAVDLSRLVESKLDFFAELIAHKHLSAATEIEKGIVVQMHPALAEILVSNLLTNAIRHSSHNGSISITVGKHELSISNEGKPLNDPGKIFERFYKENQSSESTGLGLALVRQIAEASGMKAGYAYRENRHIFSISF